MWSPIWLIVLPLLMAFISVVVKKSQYGLLVATLLLNTALLFFVENGIVYIGGFLPPFGISLRLDPYAWVALFLIQVILLMTVYIARVSAQKYGAVLLVLLAGINGMLLTNDLFNLFVMIEVVSIASFIMSAANKKWTQTFHYIVLGSVGGVFFLLGTVLVYVYTGTLVIEGLFQRLSQLPISVSLVPMLLIILGLAVELKLMPVGSWAKGIYGNATILTGTLFAAVLAPAFGFVFGRLMSQVIVLSQPTGYALLSMALITFIFGELAAYRQLDLRKTLAFSSIAQSGLAIILFALGLTFPAVLLLVSNALSKAVMFWVATGLQTAYGSTDINDLKGVFYDHLLLGLAFSIACLSLVGIPMFFGFYVKMTVIMSIFSTGLYWVPVVILLMAIVEGAYLMNWLLKLWSPAVEGHLSDGAEAPVKKQVFDFTRILAIVIVALFLVAIGIMPLSAGQVLSEASQAGISDKILTAEKGGH